MRAHSPSYHHVWLMLLLTFSTGIIDAVGYLGLDRVFTGNMTGNVVILGMGLAGADDLPVLGPTLALCGFVVGAAVAGRALHPAPAGWSRRVTVLLMVTGTVELLAATAFLTGLDPREKTMQFIVTTVVSIGMGMQAAAARHLAVKDVTTVVVTSTITGLAADTVSGLRRAGSGRRVLAVALILGGAAAGAALLLWHIAAGFLVAAVLTLTAAGCGEVLCSDRRQSAAAALPSA